MEKEGLWSLLILLGVIILGMAFMANQQFVEYSPSLKDTGIKQTSISDCFDSLENKITLSNREIKQIERTCSGISESTAEEYAASFGIISEASGNDCSLGMDFNGDGIIDFADLVIVLQNWGRQGGGIDIPGDANGDGIVDFSDLLIILFIWGEVIDCTECEDEFDNDNDQLIDALDPGCWDDPDDSQTYNSELDDESLRTLQCQDGIDNDRDGKTDFPDDNGCGNRFANNEVYHESPGIPDCSDGIDNDNDGLIDWGFTDENEIEYCSNPNDESEQDVLHEYIRWDDFPDFSLHESLTTIYSGLWLYPSDYYPERNNWGDIALRRGFSHIRGVTLDPLDRGFIPPEKRAAMWSPAYAHYDHPINDEQPWADHELKSPWENDLDAYNEYWAEAEMRRLANHYPDTYETNNPNVAYLVADIEQHWINDASILANLKDNPEIPEEIRELDDEAFVDLYKRNMTKLYDIGAGFPKYSLETPVPVSSYLDVPIPRNARIDRFTIDRWATDPSLLNWIIYDYTQEGEGFYENIGPIVTETYDFLTPSGYFLNNYPDSYEQDPESWEEIGNYLAYNLFMIDGNRLWIDEDMEIVLWQWLRFRRNGNCDYCGLRPWMAHSIAIFPFFSSNTGMWLFDGEEYHNSNENYPEITDELQSQNKIAYDNFIYGLYRLSQFNEFFEGNYQTYHPSNSVELISNKEPVWRGIVNEAGDKMLVTAHNPYARPDQATIYFITYDDQGLGFVQTRGLGVWLGTCDIGGGGGCTGDEG